MEARKELTNTIIGIARELTVVQDAIDQCSKLLRHTMAQDTNYRGSATFAIYYTDRHPASQSEPMHTAKSFMMSMEEARGWITTMAAEQREKLIAEHDRLLDRLRMLTYEPLQTTEYDPTDREEEL